VAWRSWAHIGVAAGFGRCGGYVKGFKPFCRRLSGFFDRGAVLGASSPCGRRWCVPVLERIAGGSRARLRREYLPRSKLLRAFLTPNRTVWRRGTGRSPDDRKEQVAPCPAWDTKPGRQRLVGQGAQPCSCSLPNTPAGGAQRSGRMGRRAGAGRRGRAPRRQAGLARAGDLTGVRRQPLDSVAAGQGAPDKGRRTRGAGQGAPDKGRRTRGAGQGAPDRGRREGGRRTGGRRTGRLAAVRRLRSRLRAASPRS
jgi:hypothetical protein